MNALIETPSRLRNAQTALIAMDEERQEWFTHWREVSEYFLPRRYPWLRTQREQRTADLRNRKLLDSTSTLAIRTLASGMMSGISSPARPWFRLSSRRKKYEQPDSAFVLWLDEVALILMSLMAESNLYNSLAVLYLEWATFGTAAMAIYEDFEDVFRCYNYPLGEFYIAMNASQRVDRLGRRFSMQLRQVVEKFGVEKLSPSLQALYAQGTQHHTKQVEVGHLVMPTTSEFPEINAPFMEVYFDVSSATKDFYQISPLYEWPNVTPRWELIGNDSYGVSPAMDCLADVISLQQLHLERANGLAKMVKPPLIVDQQLRNRPTSLGAGGITYAATHAQNFGAKPAYTVQLPFGELNRDIEQLRTAIGRACHNDLFNMISSLDTVRSATEIDARREEKLIHLGPVFERFSNEGLDPILRRIYGIAQRAGLLPPLPEGYEDEEIEIQYVSILSDAQRAAGTTSIERFLQMAGQAAGVWPEATQIPNVEELMRDYAEGIGIKPKSLRSREEVSSAKEAQAQQQQLAQSAAIGNDLASGAKVLSEADVGGGVNALQALMG